MGGNSRRVHLYGSDAKHHNKYHKICIVFEYYCRGEASPDAILSYHTALELHNLAYTTFEELTFLTSQGVKAFTYQSQNFRPVTFPQLLVAQHQKNTHIELIERQGITIKVTNLERTLIDILDRPYAPNNSTWSGSF